MRQQRQYPQVIVSHKAARSLAAGHPWVYASEVLKVVASPTTGTPAANGDIVDVMEANGTWQGAGLLSQQSTIRVRIVSRNANDTFDEAFWRRRIAWAWQYRMSVMGGRGTLAATGGNNGGQTNGATGSARPTGLCHGDGATCTASDSPAANGGCVGPARGGAAANGLPAGEGMSGGDLSCCRVIFGEADGFAGLVVDRYGTVLVAQVGTVGMERLRGVIYPLLLEVLRDAGEDVRHIYERCDSPSRTREGLDLRTGWWNASATGAIAHPASDITITENGVAYRLDLAGGQKTGFFLDQKYNRRAVGRISAGRRVLDCFCHVGPFGLNAARGGAAFVRCVDASQAALDLARQNALLNGLVVAGDANVADQGATHANADAIGSTTIGFTRADVLEYLPRLRRDRFLLRAEGGPFDLIVLDPPAFAKTRSAIRGAMRGYRAINEEAMRLLPRGGYLASCSCSQHMTTELLERAIAEAAHNANVQLKQVEQRQQAPDHPVLWGFPQSHYLDFFIFQVV